MFTKSNSVTLNEEILEKAKKYCKDHGLSLSHFVEEAIIEKIIKGDIK